MWGEEQEQSFQRLKSQVASAPVLAYFYKDVPTRVIAEASPVGLGTVLVQEKNVQSVTQGCALGKFSGRPSSA